MAAKLAWLDAGAVASPDSMSDRACGPPTDQISVGALACLADSL